MPPMLTSAPAAALLLPASFHDLMLNVTVPPRLTVFVPSSPSVGSVAPVVGLNVV